MEDRPALPAQPPPPAPAAAGRAPVRRQTYAMQEDEVRGAEALLPGQLTTDASGEPQSEPCSEFRYGELQFEENGRAVPYLIVPDTPEGRDPKVVVQMMMKHMSHKSKPLQKPNIAFRVRAGGKSYLEMANDVYDNDYLAQRWNWKERQDADSQKIPADAQYAPTGHNGKLEAKDPTIMEQEFPGYNHDLVTKMDRDGAIREFGDTLLAVFRDMVKGVVNSQGWFLFPAGRRPRHQLIGDTIAKYGGDLNECVMVQYNSLQNENLIAVGSGTSTEPDMTHEMLVARLKEQSVQVNLFDDETPPLDEVGRLVYPSEAHLFPNLNDIQGSVKDADGNKVSVAEYVQSKCESIGHRDISIHPVATHLIFYDMKGSRRGGGQDLPWSEIDKLHSFLTSEGVSEGTIICSGDHTDLQSAQSAVSHSTPVISFKSVAGASEFLSQLFERRQVGGPQDRGRPVGFCKRFPEDAVFEEFRAGVFQPPEEATDEEMIVVDMNNPDAGKVLQKQMAKLLSLQGASEEKMLGFPASEKARLVKAWVMSLLFTRNSAKEKFESDVLNYFMLLLNLLVVVVVIVKHAFFPTGATEPNAVTGKVESSDQLQFDVLVIVLVVLPIVSGVLLTINNAFNPMAKYNALRWAATAIESEIYEYRARAVAYSAVSSSPQWSFDAEDNETEEQESSASKKFVRSLQSISGSVRSESQLQVSSMSFFKDGESEQIVRQRIEELKKAQCMTETDEIVTHATLETARTGVDNSDGKPTPEQLRFYEDNKNRVGQALMQQLEDDGFSVLDADQYLAVRTKPSLERMKARLPKLSSKRKVLQVLIYTSTGASVVLGTFGLDLYIAITTGLVSLFTGMLEYQKLEATIVALNAASVNLHHLLLWWDSLTFVEKRMGKHRDNLVATTESAIMGEVSVFYQQGEAPEEEPKSP